MNITDADIEALLGENYLAFLLLGALLIIMYTYRNVTLPAGRVFALIAAALFVMCVASCIERWAILSPDRANVRAFASVLHYIVQPLVIYLELRVLSPHERTDKRFILLATAPLIINTCIYLAAPFAGRLVFWYREDYAFMRGPLGISVYVVTFLYLALLVLWSVKAFHQNEKRISILLLFIVGIAVLSGTLEAMNLVPGYIDEAFVLGVLLFYMYLITLYEAEIKTNLMESELRLLREQIKPHFVFNALHNIKALIRKDPDNAVLKLEDFSEYLRANLDNINSDTLISFEDELANVEAYVSLALADDSKAIELVYDIKERYFRVPPLTVEPLLENAIQHGVSDGGAITLSTFSTPSDYVIRVTDNGHGFRESGEALSDANGSTYSDTLKGVHQSVGLENVKTRLKKLCGGTLEIETGESGTTVAIHIPRQNQM